MVVSLRMFELPVLWKEEIPEGYVHGWKPWVSQSVKTHIPRPDTNMAIQLKRIRCGFKPISTYWHILRVLEYF